MKDNNNDYNEETSPRRLPNDGFEKIEIEPINWYDM